ncbi:MAG: hypothetical protein KAH84_05760 [Thiomargarita sp.]|nr:hypothetical protein [Thiomargarita sp.]
MDKKLAQFANEDTPLKWICPPVSGREMLREVLKYSSKPQLQANDIWVINADDKWNCFSKQSWLYNSTEKAQTAIRTHTQIYLQCSPLLSEQRCIVMVENTDNNWRLWQIVRCETTLMNFLKQALRKQPNKLAFSILKCATRYANFLSEINYYNTCFSPSLQTLGINQENQLIYLGILSEKIEKQPILDKDEFIQIIGAAFLEPINEALANIEVNNVIQELMKIEDSKQQYLKEMLIQLFSQAKIAL